MTDKRETRAWVDIDLDALAHNYHAIRDWTRHNADGPVKVLGMVKANAYGHGAPVIGKKLQELGAEMLAVACLDEAVQLRQAGVTIPILCLGQTPVELAGDLLEYDVTQTVGDLELGRALSAAAAAAGKELAIHIKLDTGMGRLGFTWREGSQAATVEEIKALCALPSLRAEGMFTHFAAADEDVDYTELQGRRFQEARAVLEQAGIHLKNYHCASSAAVLNYPWTHMNLIRPGIAMYGHYPDPASEIRGEPRLVPVMTLEARVTSVRTMPVGTKLGYGCTATLTKESRVAVLSIGYADGLPRSLSNKLQVKLHSTPCPILGRICMDMCMADVTALPQVRVGDVAVIYDKDLNRVAELAGTITDELVCRVSGRVPRVYWENGARIV